MDNMQPLEIEVKFFLTAVEPIRTAILQLGATPSPRVFETNIRYEDASTSFVQRKMLLRLRADAKTTLTLKSPPPKADPHFKVHKELEVEISDFDTMDAILQSIGFHRAQCYEKWRQTFVLGDTFFCIDTLPFGEFLEIEGSREAIFDLADRLGLKWHRRILFNYLEIFEALKHEHNLAFSDVSFDNFRHAPPGMELNPRRFEAGRNR